MELQDSIHKMGEAAETVNRIQDSARGRLSDVSNRLMERSKAAASSTDAYVHEYAWSSLAMAALVGVIIGLMIRRS